MTSTAAARLATIRTIQDQVIALLATGQRSHAKLLYVVELKYSERDLVVAVKGLLAAEIIERVGDEFALVVE